MNLHEGNSANVHYNDSHWDAPGMSISYYLHNLHWEIYKSNWEYGVHAPNRLLISPKIVEEFSKRLEEHIHDYVFNRSSTSIDNGVITKLFGYPVEIGDDKQVDQFIIIWEGL